MNGTVKVFGNKGYGFVRGEDGKEYFCHYTDILMDGYRMLHRGDKVEFDTIVDETSGKSKVSNVKRVG